MTTEPSAATATFEESWDSFLVDGLGGLAATGAGRSAIQEREAAWLEDALLVTDFSAMPLRRLRATANRLYRMLDTDFPSAGALERYETVSEELALREAESRGRTV